VVLSKRIVAISELSKTFLKDENRIVIIPAVAGSYDQSIASLVLKWSYFGFANLIKK